MDTSKIQKEEAGFEALPLTPLTCSLSFKIFRLRQPFVSQPINGKSDRKMDPRNAQITCQPMQIDPKKAQITRQRMRLPLDCQTGAVVLPEVQGLASTVVPSAHILTYQWPV